MPLPNSNRGEAWFIGIIDSVSGAGLSFLLGQTISVTVDYRLKTVPGSNATGYVSSVGNLCYDVPLINQYDANCLEHWVGPSSPDGVGVGFANGQLSSVFDFYGKYGLNWNTSTTRFNGWITWYRLAARSLAR